MSQAFCGGKWSLSGTQWQSERDQEMNHTDSSERHLFGRAVVSIRQPGEVWQLTPHGQALGQGMAKARHALIGKSAIEIGVGNGIHAVAALKLGVRSIDVTDIVPAALETAAANAIRNNVQLRSAWIRDWMNFEPPERYDLVLCNPPFCKAGLPNRRHFIQQSIQCSPCFLRPGGHLLFVQSSMADFSATERELAENGFDFSVVHTSRGFFRDYYFTEPGFIEESSRVAGGYEVIDDAHIETLRVYLCTHP